MGIKQGLLEHLLQPSKAVAPMEPIELATDMEIERTTDMEIEQLLELEQAMKTEKQEIERAEIERAATEHENFERAALEQLIELERDLLPDLEDLAKHRIPDYPEYAASEMEVYSFKTKKFLKAFRRSRSSPYLAVSLQTPEGQRTCLLHRVIWASRHQQKIPEGLEIDHIDRNIYNNHISNLRLVTWTENNKNSSKAQRPVVAISLECGGKLTFPSVKSAARSLGVNSGTVSHICNGRGKTVRSKTWAAQFTFEYVVQ